MYGSSMSNFDKVVDFNQKCGKLNNTGFRGENVQRALDLISEEFEELQEAYYEKNDRANLIKEAADLLYVTYGLFAAIGINADDVFREVHWSNMSKLTNGRLLKDENGKVLKGPDYRPPDMEQFF